MELTVSLTLSERKRQTAPCRFAGVRPLARKLHDHTVTASPSDDSDDSN